MVNALIQIIGMFTWKIGNERTNQLRFDGELFADISQMDCLQKSFAPTDANPRALWGLGFTLIWRAAELVKQL